MRDALGLIYEVALDSDYRLGEWGKVGRGGRGKEGTRY